MNNFSLLPSNNTDDGIVEGELDIEDSTVSQFNESPIEKSLESLFEQVMSPKLVTKVRLQDSMTTHYCISVHRPRNCTQIFSRIVQQIFSIIITIQSEHHGKTC
jgi:hypothetical protein